MTILEHLETELGRDVLGWSSYLRYKLVRCLAGILQHDSMEAKTFGMTSHDLAYMMYMQYPFVFGCLRNVMSTFGMGITWRDH